MSKPIFDPNTSDDPCQRRKPLLPDECSEQERVLANKFTRVAFSEFDDDGNELTASFLVVGAQSFQIGTCRSESPQDAGWMCLMMAKALANIISQESNGDDTCG